MLGYNFGINKADEHICSGTCQCIIKFSVVSVMGYTKVHLHKHNTEIILNAILFTRKHDFGIFINGEFSIFTADRNCKNEIH